MKNTSKDSLSAVQVITYLVVCGTLALIIGLDYPLVPRGNFIQGQSGTLHWWSLFLVAICAAVIVRFKRSWFKWRGGRMLGAFLYFAYFIGGLLVTSQLLMVINGAFDNSPVLTHQTTIINKYIGHGRSTIHHLVVRDWEKPDRLLDFDIGKGAYESLDTSAGRRVGERITIKTSKGFLGFERFRGLDY